MLVDLKGPPLGAGAEAGSLWPAPRRAASLSLPAPQAMPRPDAGAAVVTGVAGFIGSHLAEALLREGWTVLGIDRHTGVADASGGGDLGELVSDPRFRLVTADLAIANLRPLFDGASVVFHLAAMTGVRSSWGDQFASYARANILATQRVAQACADAGVPRLVLASSSSVYGPSPGRPSRESDRPAPRSPYAASKLAAEQLAVTYAHRARDATEVVVLQYFTVYGPRQRPDMLITRVLQAAQTGEPVVVFGDGSQSRSFTYVGDAVAPTVRAATCRVDRSVVFNVAGHRSANVHDVLDLAADVCGGRSPPGTAARRTATCRPPTPT